MKRLGLSGGVIVVAAITAAMVAGAAYGITKSAVGEGELDPIACVNATGGACTQAVNMDEPTGLALSDDQSRVFVATHSSDGMSIFVLDRKTRLMSQYRLDRGGCINETGTGGCFDGRGLDGAMGVTSSVSHTYVAAETSGAVTLIRKKTTTKIWDEPTDPGACISDTGSDGCSDGRGLPGARSVAFSADHHYVYVGGTKSIAVFSRNTQTGLLTQLSGSNGCVNDDGSDGCADGYIPDNVNDIVASDDGKTLYAASSGPGNGALLVFDVNKANGSITQKPGTAGCFSDDGSGGDCTDGVALVGPDGHRTRPQRQRWLEPLPRVVRQQRGRRVHPRSADRRPPADAGHQRRASAMTAPAAPASTGRRSSARASSWSTRPTGSST